MKGGLVSSAVAFLCVASALYFWNSHHTGKAVEAHDLAVQEFQAEEFQAAEEHWNQALASYRSVYSSDGQASVLYHISRCQMGRGDFDSAVESLARAIKLDKQKKYEEAVLKYHRIAAVDALELSEEFIDEEDFEKAEIQSDLAVKRFKKGQGTKKQLAGAFRQHALCAALNHDFKKADNLLDEAINLTGESKQTADVASDIALLYKEAEAAKLAAAKDNRYIPDGEIDLTKINPGPKRRTQSRSTGRSYSYKPKSRSSNYRRPSRPRVVKTSLGDNGQAYPTGKKRYNRASSYNRYNRYNGYSSYNRYRPSSNYSNSRRTSSAKPSYPTAKKTYRPSSTYRPNYNSRYPGTRVTSRPTRYTPVRSTGLSR